MKYFNIFLKAILAGICIGIGGTVNLLSDNKIIGATLFGIGLFIIVTNKYNLFTGKVGYVVDNKLKYILDLLLILLGNFIGTFLVAFALSYTRIYSTIYTNAVNLTVTKLADTWYSIFVLAIFCGILMYTAVDGYKKIQDSFGKNLCVFICVIVFILAGFEHCIANMYYFNLANVWNARLIIYLLIMIIGNSIGAILFSGLKKLTQKENE